MDIQLDSGYTIVPYKQCEQFFLDECETLIYINGSPAMRRFFANMWLWNVRRQAWVTASIWEAKSQGCFKHLPLQEPSVDVLTAFRLLEGLILKLITSIETRNVVNIVNQEAEIKLLMKNIEKSLKICKIDRAK